MKLLLVIIIGKKVNSVVGSNLSHNNLLPKMLLPNIYDKSVVKIW